MSTEVHQPTTESTTRIKTCGLVMPISPIDGMPASHWEDVKNILIDVAVSQGFETNLVSTATVSGLLPERIVTNLYQNDLVICDVSGRNPNVMFELGLRLAFDKPTIIIKDDATEYVFDIQSIGHLDYPRSLRITKMEVFKKNLSDAINATHAKNLIDPNYSTFLKHYKIFEAKKLDSTSDFQSYLDSKIDQLTSQFAALSQQLQNGNTNRIKSKDGLIATSTQKVNFNEVRMRAKAALLDFFGNNAHLSVEEALNNYDLQSQILYEVNNKIGPVIRLQRGGLKDLLEEILPVQ